MANNRAESESQRIVALEERLAHQTMMIEELSGTVAQQWEQIDRMQKKLTALTTRFLDLEDATAPAPEITKPPHY